jgi:DNA polymerase-3 subunit alpha
VRDDRFSGGMQLTVKEVFDLETARCRFGKHLRVPLRSDARRDGDVVTHIQRLLREFPPRKVNTDYGDLAYGLGVRIALESGEAGEVSAGECAAARAELQLGEEARFYPSDAALAQWRGLALDGQATLVFD